MSQSAQISRRLSWNPNKNTANISVSALHFITQKRVFVRHALCTRILETLCTAPKAAVRRTGQAMKTEKSEQSDLMKLKKKAIRNVCVKNALFTNSSPWKDQISVNRNKERKRVEITAKITKMR